MQLTTPESMTVFHSPLSLLHDPPYEILSGELKPYVESPHRYHRVLSALFPKDSETQVFKERRLDWKKEEVIIPELMEAVRSVHTEEYVAFLRDIYEEWVAEGGSKAAVLPETFLRSDLLLESDPGVRSNSGAIEKAGRHSFDLSCPIMAETYISALASCRVALEAAAYLLTQSIERGVFALCRPPGHHSTPNLCGGYCFINNAAVAARYLQSKNVGEKVAILDIDYHHGNGTSKVFYTDPSVLYVSLHGSPDYPYFTGATTETGAGAGLGTNVNFPLPLGTDNATYLQVLTRAIEIIQAWGPQKLVVSLGCDTYIDDPLTDFKVTREAYPEMGRLISRVGVPTLFVMEGGYYLPELGNCVRGVLQGSLSE